MVRSVITFAEKWLSHIGLGLVTAVFLGIGLSLFIAFSPLIIIGVVTFSFSERAFCKEYQEFLHTYEGTMFFCYTSRKTSRAFIEQNIVPLLNEKIQIIFLEDKTPRSAYEEQFISRMLVRIKERKGFPNVMRISDGKVIDKSFKESFYNTMNQKKDVNEFIREIDRFFEQPG